MSKLQSVIICPDVHRPFHNKDAWALLLKTVKIVQPDKFIILGDFGDFYSISSHGKNPQHRNLLLVDEVASVEEGLDELDALLPKKCTKDFIQGNHEWRFDRYIQERAPDLYGLTDTAKLFDLKRRGWRYTPYHHSVRIGKVFYTHDTGKAGANAHRQAERAFSDNAVIGHTHRMALEVSGNSGGKPHVCGMFGWLGDIDAAEYMHLINARRDWTLGFGTGHMKADGTTFLQMHPIVNNEVCVDGQLIGLRGGR